MYKAQAVAQHLPYLRRYARALTGSQASGDAYVAAALEALVKEPQLLETDDLPRVALFRLFSAIWNSLSVNRIPDPVRNEFPADRRRRYETGYSLSQYDASVIIDQGRTFADYFEPVAEGCGDGKQAANWLTPW